MATVGEGHCCSLGGIISPEGLSRSSMDTHVETDSHRFQEQNAWVGWARSKAGLGYLGLGDGETAIARVQSSSLSSNDPTQDSVLTPRKFRKGIAKKGRS